MSADLLIIIAVVCIAAINRQSFIFVFAYLITEIPYYLNTNPVYDNVFLSVMFAILAVSFKGLIKQLRFALVIYAFIFWLAGLDYFATTQETVFYAIFPFLIKAIDCYVIFNLIIKREQQHGAYNSPFGGAWFKRLDNL